MNLSKLLIPKIYLLFAVVLLSSTLSMAQLNKDSTTSIQETNNLSYYKDQNLDSDLTQVNLILPKGIKNPPVFMWIGGGAWAYVDRNKEMEICRKMAKQGIAVVSVGHRLSPALLWEPKKEEGIKHPEHVKDVAQAFKWVYENADKYGYSKENIFVGGFSSGAHLSALLAMDGKYLEVLGLSNKMIKGIIPVGGGYDIPLYRKSLVKEDSTYDANHILPVFGTTHEEHVDASPVTYIDKLITPILMISEGETYEYSSVFEQRLKEKGYKNYQVLNAHNETHASLWLNLRDEKESRYRNFIVDYIKAQSKVTKKGEK
ncbi:MAG: alpha/beta hydrolase [Aureispira sp.]|nr:alpha/beta hydrolase [Aureispira sp.]